MKAIIKYTLLEFFRNKIYLSALLLIFIISLVSWMGSQINININAPWISIFAFGMSFTSILSLAMALFLPVGHIHAEYERGTAQVYWSKLANPLIYYIGKYVAFVGLIFFIIASSSLLVGGISFLAGAKVNHVTLLSVYAFAQTFACAMVVAVTFLLYSLIRSSATASLLCLLMLLFGIFLDSAQDLALRSSSFMARFVYSIIYYGMPKLSYFNVENIVIYQESPSSVFLIGLLSYGVCVIAGSISIAMYFFGVRDA